MSASDPTRFPVLTRLADGTVKQRNPFTGTEVWTVPGRADRPLGQESVPAAPLDRSLAGRYCAFCERRYLDTPPEKARLVRSIGGTGERWQQLDGLLAEELDETVAEFRRIPNLFEILPLDYWRANYGYQPADALRAQQHRYVSTPAGRRHVLSIVRRRLAAAGLAEAEWPHLSEDNLLQRAEAFFASGHEVIVARRHFVDDAGWDDQLAYSGSLTAEEHFRYVGFTAQAMRALYEANPYVRYVAVFQNWLRQAGASFDHLHKQLAGIDEYGGQTLQELEQLRSRPDLFNAAAVNEAIAQDLLLAENDHAVAFAGFGHRYPTLEVYSKSAACLPWLHSEDELRAMSELLHACHAATGATVPTNEEWHHQPPRVVEPMPWRVMVKWRVSTIAGFEGGTKIYLNTIDPWSLRDRVLPRFFELREQGMLARSRIGPECTAHPDSLRYQQHSAR
ncbi:DUF4921 family protein [Microlunatus panaciterrae]|uniref:Galactose-1-phosphate uridylyltransferase n=1 Tax=Microlunatus panaciterrae TaxID=400768 RepID=A0ABS2RG97_9ACTN|nr:DUF4921 family protein [Microlunatus panaciterrae]MBM7797206.1 galactose-1-phosphate uridylyltransferase [Microlunatus panaciterrae]